MSVPGAVTQAAAPDAATRVPDEFLDDTLRQTSRGAAALFVALGLGLALGPLYRGFLFGAVDVPPAALLLEWLAVIPACAAGAWLRLRSHAPAWMRHAGLAATVVAGTGLVLIGAVWTRAGVAFPPALAPLYVIAVLVASGRPQSQVLPPMLALLALDAGLAHTSGWSHAAHVQAFTDAAAALLGAWIGRENEQHRYQLWLDQRRLGRMAGDDALTHVKNLRALEIHASAALAQARREHRSLALALVDLDHFKHYNDTYGHMTGDGALILVADALSKSARRPLDAVARIGGGTFAVLWYDTDATVAAERFALAMKVIADLYLPHRDRRGSDHVTVSIGAVPFDPASVSFAQAIDLAGARLRAAKQGGRNKVVMEG